MSITQIIFVSWISMGVVNVFLFKKSIEEVYQSITDVVGEIPLAKAFTLLFLFVGAPVFFYLHVKYWLWWGWLKVTYPFRKRKRMKQFKKDVTKIFKDVGVESTIVVEDIPRKREK